MSDVPKHDHPGLGYAVVFFAVVFSLLLGFIAIQVAHPVYRPELRCSAFVTPPKGCKP